MLLSLTHNINFYAKHIQGVANVSAFQVTGLRIQNQVSPFGQRTDTSSSFPNKDLSQAADYNFPANSAN